MGYGDINDKKDFNKDIDIYGDDDLAVSAVGGLFDEPDDKSADDEVVDVRGASAHERPSYSSVSNTAGIRRPTVREYKVREYFSEEDDVSAEDDPANDHADENPGGLSDYSADDKDSDTTVPPVAKRNAFSPENEDYGDYIRATSRQIAEERAKKGRNGFGNAPRETAGMVRDASRNPAVRKEREASDDAPEQDDFNAPPVPRTTGRSPYAAENSDPSRTDTGRQRARGTVGHTDRQSASGIPERSHNTGAHRTREPARDIPAPEPVREPAREPHREPGRTAPLKPAVQRAPTGQTGKLPVKGNVPKRSEYFEAENRGGDVGDTLRSLADPRIIMGGFIVILLVVLVFLFIQNMSLRADIRDTEAFTDDMIALQDDIVGLRLTNDELIEENASLRDDLNYYMALASNHALGNPGSHDPATDLGTGNPANPMPTPPPAHSTVPTFSIWVALPNGPTTSVIKSPSFNLDSLADVHPTICTINVMVPRSVSASAMVSGIRSPPSPMRMMTKCPALRLCAMRTASISILNIFSDRNSFLTILFIIIHLQLLFY